VPFLQFSDRRDLRQKAYLAWGARGANGGATDNRAIAAETLALRQERAALLGYASFADFKLETEMAGNPAAVRDLLMQVWNPAKAAAEADAAVLADMLQGDGHAGPLEPWDWRYYSEKRRRALHDLDEAELKPYLQLDRMIAAAFACANRLFGLDFTAIDGPRLPSGCADLGGDTQWCACRGVHRRLLRAGIKTVRRLVFGDAVAKTAGRRYPPACDQRVQLRQTRGGQARAFVL